MKHLLELGRLAENLLSSQTPRILSNTPVLSTNRSYQVLYKHSPIASEFWRLPPMLQNQQS